MTEREALEMGAKLAEWARSSPDARLAIRGMTKSYGYNSMGELAVAEPEAFELMYESIKDMMEQLPDYWTP